MAGKPALHTWSRREIEAAAAIEPEVVSYVRIRISMKLLKTLIDWAESQGDHIELISAFGQPGDAELKFYRRD